MTFRTIHTNAGLQAMYAAASAGDPVELTHMAVGDGAGNPVTPVETQTGLVRELYRTTINRVWRPDPVNEPERFSAEMVIPATEGGFVLREVGVFDADGALFAVGNLPETYKPEASEGAFADTVVRIEFIATNADVVSLQIDPNVAVATQAWVINNMTAATIIPGGTTAQVLTKVSNADGDYEWRDAGDVNVVVNTIEEYQVLAASQTVVTMSTVTTTGLAVYIDGVRLAQDGSAEGWQPDGIDPAKLTLGKSYPAGTEIILVQNEPAGQIPDALLRAQNLADIPDKPLARQNLGVPSFTDLQNAVPPGAVMHFARATPPAGWLKADGSEVDRTTYAALFDAIGTTFGAGNGVDSFNLPDLRAEFIRGLDDGRGVDSGRALGSAQGDMFKAHTHAHNLPRSEGSQGGSGFNITFGHYGSPYNNPTGSTGGPETRPRNIALLACIKA